MENRFETLRQLLCGNNGFAWDKGSGICKRRYGRVEVRIWGEGKETCVVRIEDDKGKVYDAEKTMRDDEDVVEIYRYIRLAGRV